MGAGRGLDCVRLAYEAGICSLGSLGGGASSKPWSPRPRLLAKLFGNTCFFCLFVIWGSAIFRHAKYPVLI